MTGFTGVLMIYDVPGREPAGLQTIELSRGPALKLNHSQEHTMNPGQLPRFRLRFQIYSGIRVSRIRFSLIYSANRASWSICLIVHLFNRGSGRIGSMASWKFSISLQEGNWRRIKNNGDAEDNGIPAQEHGQAPEEETSFNLGYASSSSSSQGTNISISLCNFR